MRNFRLYLTVILALAGFKASAQTRLTVEEAIATALRSNYDIRLLKNDSMVLALQDRYATYALYPRLNAGTTVLFNNNNLKQKLPDGSIRKGDGIRSSNVGGNLSLNWLLFDGLRMFAVRDRISEQLKLGGLTIKTEMANLIADVIRNYYRIVRQKQQLHAIEDQMQINEERLRQAEKKLSVGLGAKPELLQSKLDLNAQKASRFTELNQIELLKEQLLLLMGMETGIEFDVADSIPIRKDLLMEDVLQTAEKNNQALLASKQQIEIARIQLKERKAERYPTLQFNAAYNYNKLTNQTVVNNFTPLFNRNHGFNYGLTLQMPIFNGYQVKQQIKTAELDLQYQQLSFESTRFRMNNAIRTAYKNYAMQLQILALEEENILLARENVQIAMERNRLGISTILELRETQKSLEEAYNRLIAARFNTKFSETELLRLRGDLVR